jgi:2-polyprenyl-3-methyl-5-hydroxy-6-metoxy-1,4-benzoquinol methylase
MAHEKSAEAIQSEYYRRTAATYDETHVHEGDGYAEALEHIARLLPGLGVRTILDTGCGTGRGLRFFRERFPEIKVQGNDPSADVLKVAHERHGIPAASLIHADTLALTDAPGSYDVVTEFGILHHVPRPSAIIAKMLELAGKAIFISDSNYLGQGSWPKRFVKLALTETGLWKPLKYVAQGFKPWSYLQGDGVIYSYSVFSDLPMIEEACKQVWIMPIGEGAQGAMPWPRLAPAACSSAGSKARTGGTWHRRAGTVASAGSPPFRHRRRPAWRLAPRATARPRCGRRSLARSDG